MNCCELTLYIKTSLKENECYHKFLEKRSVNEGQSIESGIPSLLSFLKENTSGVSSAVEGVKKSDRKSGRKIS